MNAAESDLRVVIADDSALLREGIARLIEESGGTVVAKVADGDAFVAAVVEHRPDVSVVDVRMPPTQRDEGLRAAIEARRRVPGTPILVLSQYVERQYATELLADRGGGVGYLLKDRVGDIPEFMDALRRVARGGTALDSEVVAQLMVRNKPDDPLAALTPREREVLAAMAEGRTNVGIARLLTHHRRRHREAHQQHLRQARAAPDGGRPPPGAGGADLPGLLDGCPGRDREHGTHEGRTARADSTRKTRRRRPRPGSQDPPDRHQARSRAPPVPSSQISTTSCAPSRRQRTSQRVARAVLGDIRERLGRDEVRRALDGGRQTLTGRELADHRGPDRRRGS